MTRPVDTDQSTAAAHHTLGTGPNQAAAGDHDHGGGGGVGAHTHVESDTTSLVSDLGAKLVKASNLSDVASASTARTNLGAAATSHTHAEADVTSLTTDLAGKAASVHTHTQAQSHNSPDTDSGTSSLHHTIGTSATQAAAGSHSHTLLTDSGRVTTGFTIQAGWSVTSTSYRMVGDLVHLRVTVTRTGADITATAAGNIADTDIVQLPAAIFPDVLEVFPFDRGGTASGTGVISTTGSVDIRSMSPTAVITAGTTVTITHTYMTS